MAKFELPKLPYEYNALEPYISQETLHLHHDKHHQAYCDKFNAALEVEKISETNIFEIFSNISKYSKAVRNNGGGYFNHIFYFESLKTPDENNAPSGILAEAIEKNFGSFENFKKEFSNSAATLFGSGWTWLGVKNNGELTIYNTQNQDNCFMDIINENSTPILVIDVWEHAYYIDYQNKRPEYIENFFKLINWKKVLERYSKIIE